MQPNTLLYECCAHGEATEAFVLLEYGHFRTQDCGVSISNKELWTLCFLGFWSLPKIRRRVFQAFSVPGAETSAVVVRSALG